MKVGAGKKAPELVNVFIEIPMGGNIKYEYDPEEEVVKLDRILYTSTVYPFNYGFVPKTMGEDHDPIDILVISSQPFAIGTVVEAKPIGMLKMKDEEGTDTKIVAVPKEKIDPNFKGINELTDLPEALRNKLVHFFETYKQLEPGKWVKIEGIAGAEEARKKIKEAMARKK